LLEDETNAERARHKVRPINRISMTEKLAYSLGDSASNLYWKTLEFFIVIFYTDVFGLPVAAVGAMLLLTRGAAAAADLAMGSIADRTMTRWGQFRPYLLWGAVPLAVTGVFTFTTPNFDVTGKLWYAYVTCSLLMFAYTALNTPYSALMGVMTPNTVERTSISSIRFVGAFASALFVQCMTLRFVNTFGRGSDARGWQLTMLLYGVLATVLLLICFLCTRERVISSRQQAANIKCDLRSLFESRPWLILVSVQLLTLSAFAIQGAATAYYFKYFVKRQDLLGMYLATNGLGYLAAVLITSRLAGLIGKKLLFMTTLGLGSLVVSLFSYMEPNDIRTMFVLQILSSFMLGFKSPLVFAMFADIADHIEWKNCRRTMGLVLGSAIFSTKLGMAIGGWIFAVILAYCGYVANVEQAGPSLHGIVLSMSWIPSGMLAAATLVIAFYQLDDNFMEKVEESLALRREQNKL